MSCLCSYNVCPGSGSYPVQIKLNIKSFRVSRLTFILLLCKLMCIVYSLFACNLSLQTVCLRSPLGQSASQTLPLKNAGNIDVQLRLKVLFLVGKPNYWNCIYLNKVYSFRNVISKVVHREQLYCMLVVNMWFWIYRVMIVTTASW